MEQRDYLLREVEKIGLVLRMILSKLVGKEEMYSTTAEKQFEEVDELLLQEIGFDIDHFLSLEELEIEPYLSRFKGISGSNIELLADILNEMGMRVDASRRILYLGKALSVYHLCNSMDKTYSLEREGKICEINKNL